MRSDPSKDRSFGITPLSMRRGLGSRLLRGRLRPPAEQTNAEHYYLYKLMKRKTRLVLQLTSGERLMGVLDWYDGLTMRLFTHDGQAVLIPKASLKYFFLQDSQYKPAPGRAAAPAGANDAEEARNDG